MKYKLNQAMDCLWGGLVGLALGYALATYSHPQVVPEPARCDLQHYAAAAAPCDQPHATPRFKRGVVR